MNISDLENGSKLKIGEDPVADKKTMEDAFNEVLEVGKYKFRMKKVKGKDLFYLVNTFSFAGNVDNYSNISNSKTRKEKTDEINSAVLKSVFEAFGENFDLAMRYIEFSINNRPFSDLVINGIYQVPEVETNIALMYKLLFFVFTAVKLFMQISQQQLNDM